MFLLFKLGLREQAGEYFQFTNTYYSLLHYNDKVTFRCFNYYCANGRADGIAAKRV